MGTLKRHLSTFVIAFVTAAVTAGGPALAAAVAEAVNADTVDGRHAVGPGASPAERAGKLVATNRSGTFPRSVVGKAADADRLDGLDSSRFARAVLPSGDVLHGEYAAWGSTAGYLGDTVSFRTPIPADLDATDVAWRSSSARPTARCPGPGQAAAGTLCVYEVGGGSRSAAAIKAPEDGGAGASTLGFTVMFSAVGGGTAFSYGTWTYQAP